MTSPADIRQARLLLAERFFHESLLPAIARGEDVDVVALYRAFQRANPGNGSDFDLSHVYIHAFERDLHNEHLERIGAIDRIPLDAPDVSIAVHLLDEVAFKELPE
jgi:hypothetical protein